MPRLPYESRATCAVAANRLAFAWAEAIVAGALVLSLSVLILMIGSGAGTV